MPKVTQEAYRGTASQTQGLPESLLSILLCLHGNLCWYPEHHTLLIPSFHLSNFQFYCITATNFSRQYHGLTKIQSTLLELLNFMGYFQSTKKILAWPRFPRCFYNINKFVLVFLSLHLELNQNCIC